MKPALIAAIAVLVLLLLGSGFFIMRGRSSPGSGQPTPTPDYGTAEQLPAEKQPKAALEFDKAAHYVTVNITNIQADQVEYNLIYSATVKGNRIQSGVNASAKMEGKTEYSQEQLLGSESSGKFTYHEGITDAIMELTLRDAQNRSVFSATYPFEVVPGGSVDLTPQ